MITKIVTHNGTFHADELAAIALIQWYRYNKIPIERVAQVSPADLEDAYVVVLDIGRIHDPRLWNFDHHQDPSLPATNILVLAERIRFQGTNNRYPNLNDRFAELVDKYLFDYISKVDRGEIIERPGSTPTINTIIRNCNNLANGFEIALQIMQETLNATIAAAEQRIQSENIWQHLPKERFFVINDSIDFLVGWQELAEESGYRYLIKPNQRGGWEISSRDSNMFSIPPDPRQTFRHNSGFMAVYQTKEDAIDHAIQIC